MKAKYLIIVLIAITLVGCDKKQSIETVSSTNATNEVATTVQPTTESTIPIEQTTGKTISNEEYVDVAEYIPTIIIDLKYATVDNFTGQVIYNFNKAYLRFGTVKKLRNVQNELLSYGYTLKIWDAYRPVSAQYTLWEVVSDPTYVANPNRGPSGHNLGNCLDITIVKTDGTEIVMPTGFDDFSKCADRDYSDVSEAATQNALLLENTMIKHGFKGYHGEWWDYTDLDSYSYIAFIP